MTDDPLVALDYEVSASTRGRPMGKAGSLLRSQPTRTFHVSEITSLTGLHETTVRASLNYMVRMKRGIAKPADGFYRYCGKEKPIDLLPEPVAGKGKSAASRPQVNLGDFRASLAAMQSLRLKELSK